MKRIFFTLVCFILLFTNCDKKLCETPPSDFHLFIDKSSSLYQDFLNDKEEFDKENVFFYQLLDKKTEKKYETDFALNSVKEKEYAVIYIYPTPFLHTGKTETLYLKNKVKSYKIDFIGTLGECGATVFKEMHIDGVKNDDFILK